jgi:uncharacterized membrane protein HdeD (DUF308 family)
MGNEKLNKRAFGWMKGIIMILLGLALLFYPGFTLVSMTRLVAVLLLVKGAMAGLILLLSRSQRSNPSMLPELLFDVGIGLLILYNPGGTISFFVVILAIWALIGGLLMAFSFSTLRKAGLTSWGLFVNSIIALSFGLVLVFEPLRGGMALATLIGAFALVYGIVNLLSVAFQKRA